MKNTKTRGVMSLWTQTPQFTIRRGSLLLQTLAANLAANAFAETQFVTDELGAELAAILGWPFGEVSTALETWPADGLQHIWALGKLAACTLQSGQFVQFDGDVLLFKPLPESFTSSRLLAQSEDYPQFYESVNLRTAREVAGLPPGATAFNAGLIGGADASLVRAYAWTGLELAEKFRGSEINGTAVSMMIEQYQLGVFSERVGVPVATLLPLHASKEQIEEAGYSHLWGSSKHSPKWLSRVEARLARDFPEAHARFIEGWRKIATRLPSPAPCGSGIGEPFASEF